MPCRYLSDRRSAVTGTERSAGVWEGAAKLHMLSGNKSENFHCFKPYSLWDKVCALFNITWSRDPRHQLNDTQKKGLSWGERIQKKIKSLKMAVRPAGWELGICANTSPLPGVLDNHICQRSTDNHTNVHACMFVYEHVCVWVVPTGKAVEGGTVVSAL